MKDLAATKPGILNVKSENERVLSSQISLGVSTFEICATMVQKDRVVVMIIKTFSFFSSSLPLPRHARKFGAVRHCHLTSMRTRRFVHKLADSCVDRGCRRIN